MKGTTITGAANNLLRFGYVSSYDAKKHMARVIFPELDNLVSGWLMVSVPNAKDNRDIRHLDINEHVAVLMSGNGTEQGLVLCALYDDENTPTVENANIRSVEYKDKTECSYDREKHIMNVKFNDGTSITYDGESHKLSYAHTDGTSITYDGELHKLTIDCVGDIGIKCDGAFTAESGGNMRFTAPRIDLN